MSIIHLSDNPLAYRNWWAYNVGGSCFYLNLEWKNPNFNHNKSNGIFTFQHGHKIIWIVWPFKIDSRENLVSNRTFPGCVVQNTMCRWECMHMLNWHLISIRPQDSFQLPCLVRCVRGRNSFQSSDKICFLSNGQANLVMVTDECLCNVKHACSLCAYVWCIIIIHRIRAGNNSQKTANQHTDISEMNLQQKWF